MPVADVFDRQIKVYVLALFQGYSLRTYLEDTRQNGLIRKKIPAATGTATRYGSAPRIGAARDPTMTP